MNKNKKIIDIVVFGSLSIVLFYCLFYNLAIKKNQIFLIAKVNKIEYSASNDVVIYYEYKYKGVTYKHSYLTLGRVNYKYLMLNISANNPSMCNITNDFAVPICLQNDKFLNTFWRQFPACP